MSQTTRRILSPYEKNQLRKHDISEDLALSTESPVEYLTHHVDFCKLDFYVDKNVLIPRIETEELVDMAVNHARNIYNKINRELNIIDIGTGSGAIPICVSKKLTKLGIPFKVLATEISKQALKVAKNNATNLTPNAPIEFKENNLLDNIEQKFDLIIANLPYIPKERIEFLDKSVKDFEPHLALDGGNSGLILIHKMIKQAEGLIYPHTKILLEVDYTHGYNDFNEFRKKWDVLVTPDSNEGVHFIELTLK